MLLSAGRASALNMAGGIEAWKAAGFATEVQYVPPATAAGEAPSTTPETQEYVRLCPPPGQVLKEEYLDPLKILPQQLAERIGVSDAVVVDLIEGKLTVDVELSLRLARFFSTAADFWIHLQIEHDLEVARQRIGRQIRKEITPRTAME
jgi:addiction module HigA family antidote